MEGQKTELKMIRMSEVESQEVKWLWYPFIPYGKLTIIQGDPGDGKTTLVLNIVAKLSKGESLDRDMNVQEPVNVIYQTAEDGLADDMEFYKGKIKDMSDRTELLQEKADDLGRVKRYAGAEQIDTIIRKVKERERTEQQIRQYDRSYGTR
jgi:RecA-family ATPase